MFTTINSAAIDLLIILFLVIFTYFNSRKGFIYGILDMIGFLLSLLIALRLYPTVSKLLQSYFGLSRGISNAGGFLLVACISEPILYFILNVFDKLINKKIIESKINRTLGFIPALFSGLILISFILTSIITLPTRPDIKQSIIESKIGGVMTKQTLGLEKYLKDIFGGAVQETLNFITVKPSGNERIDLKFKTDDFTTDPISESKMFGLINQERTERNLSPLTVDLELREVARKHCEDMFLKGYFSHYTPDGLSPFDRMDKAHILYHAAGENLAFAPTVDIAHQGLMNSPGHKANILSINFNKVGIGIISAGVYGKMFCQEFTD